MATARSRTEEDAVVTGRRRAGRRGYHSEGNFRASPGVTECFRRPACGRTRGYPAVGDISHRQPKSLQIKGPGTRNKSQGRQGTRDEGQGTSHRGGKTHATRTTGPRDQADSPPHPLSAGRAWRSRRRFAPALPDFDSKRRGTRNTSQGRQGTRDEDNRTKGPGRLPRLIPWRPAALGDRAEDPRPRCLTSMSKRRGTRNTSQGRQGAGTRTTGPRDQADCPASSPGGRPRLEIAPKNPRPRCLTSMSKRRGTRNKSQGRQDTRDEDNRTKGPGRLPRLIPWRPAALGDRAEKSAPALPDFDVQATRDKEQVTGAARTHATRTTGPRDQADGPASSPGGRPRLEIAPKNPRPRCLTSMSKRRGTRNKSQGRQGTRDEDNRTKGPGRLPRLIPWRPAALGDRAEDPRPRCLTSMSKRRGTRNKSQGRQDTQRRGQQDQGTRPTAPPHPLAAGRAWRSRRRIRARAA